MWARQVAVCIHSGPYLWATETSLANLGYKAIHWKGMGWLEKQAQKMESRGQRELEPLPRWTPMNTLERVLLLALVGEHAIGLLIMLLLCILSEVFLHVCMTSLSFIDPGRRIWLAKFLSPGARDWKREALLLWLPEWEVGCCTWLLGGHKEKMSMFTGSYLSDCLRDRSFPYTYTEKEKYAILLQQPRSYSLPLQWEIA